MRIFDRPGDYQHFLDLAGEAQRRVPVDCFAYCLMPNHFHLVLRPKVDGDLSAFMRRLCSTHGKRWNLLQGTGGTGFATALRASSALSAVGVSPFPGKRERTPGETDVTYMFVADPAVKTSYSVAYLLYESGLFERPEADELLATLQKATVRVTPVAVAGVKPAETP